MLIALISLGQFGLPVDTALLSKAADSANVPRVVMYAVAWQETRDGVRGNTPRGPGREQCDSLGCRRVCREVGRMQVNPCIRFDLPGCNDLRNYEQNATCGAWILRYLYNKWGSWPLAIQRYNGSGPKAREYAIRALAYVGWVRLREAAGSRREQ